MEKFDEFVKKIRNDLIGSAETLGYGHIVVLLNIKGDGNVHINIICHK